MSAVLTAEQALKLVGEMFVYHMPFNRALGMELERYEKEFAQLAFKNQPMMVGNWAQSILHGGVIASALDVAAGLVCVGSTLKSPSPALNYTMKNSFILPVLQPPIW